MQARVTAASVIVQGWLEGHISADRVQLGPAADVEASIVTAKLVLEDGARLSGAVNTERAQAAANVARHRQKSPAT